MKRPLLTILIVAFSAMSTSLIAQDSKITSGVIKEQNGEYFGAIQSLEEALSKPEKIKKEKNFARGYQALCSAYYGLYNEVVSKTDSKWYDNNPMGNHPSDLLLASLDNYLLFLESPESDKYMKNFPEYEVDGIWSSLYNEGVQAFNDKTEVNAYLLFESALVLKPKHIITHRLMGSIKYDSYNNAACIKHYKKAIELFEAELENPDPESDNDMEYVPDLMTSVYCHLSLLLDEEGNTDEALAVIQKGQELFPDNADIDIYEMTIWQKLPHRIDESMPLYEQFISENPDNTQVKLSYASVLNSAGKLDRSFELYKEVHDADPENYHANFGLGAYYVNAAAEINGQVLDGTGDEPADVLNQKVIDHMESAYPYMKKLHEMNPQEKEWILQLINICSMTGRDAEVEEYVKKKGALD